VKTEVGRKDGNKNAQKKCSVSKDGRDIRRERKRI
jgi:hypothetical protein